MEMDQAELERALDIGEEMANKLAPSGRPWREEDPEAVLFYYKAVLKAHRPHWFGD